MPSSNETETHVVDDTAKIALIKALYQTTPYHKTIDVKHLVLVPPESDKDTIWHWEIPSHLLLDTLTSQFDSDIDVMQHYDARNLDKYQLEGTLDNLIRAFYQVAIKHGPLPEEIQKRYQLWQNSDVPKETSLNSDSLDLDPHTSDENQQESEQTSSKNNTPRNSDASNQQYTQLHSAIDNLITKLVGETYVECKKPKATLYPHQNRKVAKLCLLRKMKDNLTKNPVALKEQLENLEPHAPELAGYFSGGEFNFFTPGKISFASRTWRVVELAKAYAKTVEAEQAQATLQLPN